MARVGDLLIASVLILLALPLMVIVALAIKLDSPGPVLSTREQWGSQGHKFQLLKFRTENLAVCPERFSCAVGPPGAAAGAV